MPRIQVRYIVDDIDAAVRFYTELLGFSAHMHHSPGFAALDLGELRLLLNSPGAGGAGKQLPDGALPAPGGWNRFQITVDNLEQEVERLRRQGATFRGELVTGRGGKQILLEDPAGNPVELFELHGE